MRQRPVASATSGVRAARRAAGGGLTARSAFTVARSRSSAHEFVGSTGPSAYSDVDDLQRKGCLKPGWSGSWEWTCDGERVAWIDLRAEEDRLRLSYGVSLNGGNREQVKEAVRLAHVSCRFGGTRPYFICPGLANGSACGRRVSKLYGAGLYFSCRHCYRLAHASQSESASDRSVRRANKVRERLGGDPGTAAEFPPRPKGMWRRTYARLREQAHGRNRTFGTRLWSQN